MNGKGINVTAMDDLDLAGKRVLIREDLNVPVSGGWVANDKRIRAALPTIRLALERGAAVMLLSHLGRPTEGQFEDKYSLLPVASALSELLGQDVRLERDWLDGVEVQPGEIVLCENVRFNPGEADNDADLARRMAALCDVFVMDAFGTAHRAQASTHGVAQHAPIAAAGPLLLAELDALARAMRNPERPLLAIVGGAKVSSKLTVLGSLSDRVDQLIVGGGIANTFIRAAGFNVGKSLMEEELLDTARDLVRKVAARGGEIPIPTDVVVATEFSAESPAVVKPVADVNDDEMILDVGPETRARFDRIIQSSRTIVWNGPVGVFEFDAFAHGTRALAESIARSPAFSIAGGGDTLAAVDQFNVTDDVSYISTGGGAFLEFLEGKTLPAVAVLEARAGG